MRVETARPWTWLLAGAAGWGVLAWALALAGMGETLPTLPDDAALARPLPPLRAAQSSRIGPLGQYSEIGQRPLFSTDRRPKPFFLQGEGDASATTAFDYVLTSVMITPNLQLAILQPPDGSQSLRVKLGDAPEPQPAWRLVSLNARSAVFEGPEGQKTLELRVFDGTGGERPTSATPGAAPATPAQAAARCGGSGAHVEQVPREAAIARLCALHELAAREEGEGGQHELLVDQGEGGKAAAKARHPHHRMHMAANGQARAVRQAFAGGVGERKWPVLHVLALQQQTQRGVGGRAVVVAFDQPHVHAGVARPKGLPLLRPQGVDVAAVQQVAQAPH